MNSDEQQSAQQLLARLVAIQDEALRNQRMMMQEQQSTGKKVKLGRSIVA